METFEEFRLKTINKERHFKVTNSWGVYDYFKYYRKNRPKDKKYILTEKQFYAFFRRVNQLLAEEFVRKQYLELPYRMGELELLQNKYKSYFVDGKLKTNRPIDWDATLKLWHEDKEACDDKTLIRRDAPSGPKIKYTKASAVYSNRAFYEFIPNRFMVQKAIKNFNNQLLCFDDIEIKNLYDG